MKMLRNLFQREQESSADVARERLKLMISQDRMQRNQPDFLPRLQKELIEVIRRYTHSASDEIHVSCHALPHRSQIEVNVSWPKNTS